MFGLTPFAGAPFADLGVGAINLEGVSATGSIGTVALSFPREVDVTGVLALGSIGDASVAIRYGVQVYPTGVDAIGAIQTVLVWGLIDENQNPNWVQIPT